MSCNKNLGNLSGALIVIVIAAIVLAPPGVCAQSTYKTLHRFTGGARGSFPYAALTFDQGGNLYGTTVNGGRGLRADGTVFKLTSHSDGRWTERVLYNFCSLANCADGSFPFATLTFDQAGNLYGTTSGGGSNSAGTAFKLTPQADGSWTESVLYSFCSLANCADGWFPIGALIFDHAGNLYDMAELGGKVGGSCGADGCGVVFKLTPHADGSWTESVLHRFCSSTNCSDGWGGGASLTFDSTGNLYGMTYRGGGFTCSCGVVFELTPNADGRWTEKVLHRFNGNDGANPVVPLIFDQAGNLYGTTAIGGDTCDCGVAFELTPNADGWTEEVLHRFNGNDGANPVAPLNFDQAGNLYGTTLYGGDMSCDPGAGCGVVFKLSPDSKGGWLKTVVHYFAAHPGAQPSAGVVFDAAGNLYGTTGGDQDTYGSVFEITP